MPTIKEILTNKVVLDIECVDRVYWNGYVKHLQRPGGLITFIREQMVSYSFAYSAARGDQNIL